MHVTRATAVLGLVAGLTWAAPASGAVVVGQTFPPMAGNCTANTTILQRSFEVGDPADYTIRTSGVITSWRYQAPAAASPQIKLKIGRSVGGNAYRVIGESDLKTPVNGALNTFVSRIPVESGDVLGLYLAQAGACEGSPAPGYEILIAMDEVSVGDGTIIFSPLSDHRLDVSASLEPDCDGDGFGDETQDPDIASCTPAASSPETTITKRPKEKTKKKRATFEFISSLPGASFECSLDGAPFAACSSPHEVSVKKGKHSFAVRASVAGQADGTPASDDWKVRRKKK